MSSEREHSTPESTGERWPVGRSILQRIRTEVNDEASAFAGDEGEDVFQTLYLTERFGCIPDHLLGEDLLQDIRSLYYYVLDGVRGELEERLSPQGFLWIVIDPSYEDTTAAALLTDERVLLVEHSKAWNFYWESEEEMAEDLENRYMQAAERVPSRSRVEPLPGGGKQYAVTLQTERLIRVRTADPKQALEHALQWRSNEDDPDIQIQQEQVTGRRVERIDGDPAEQSAPDVS
jgi:hypothetical protein